mmetsp:Transcript_28921/g.76310  ORF Transcript_28921/g.76310 Transcript_28921/m.76310 type:complete len:81 (-) Transcript_28921:93-335(-)
MATGIFASALSLHCPSMRWSLLLFDGGLETAMRTVGPPERLDNLECQNSDLVGTVLKEVAQDAQVQGLVVRMPPWPSLVK